MAYVQKFDFRKIDSHCVTEEEEKRLLEYEENHSLLNKDCKEDKIKCEIDRKIWEQIRKDCRKYRRKNAK